MLRLEAEMQKLGAKQFKVSAQVRAAGFYEKLGYVRRGEEYLDEYCPHVDMYKPAQAGIGADGMKKRKSLWLILVLLMLAGAAAVLLYLRADLRYLVKETVSGWFRERVAMVELDAEALKVDKSRFRT